MTQLALIPPLTHLELGTTNMHLLLAHMCNDKSYVQFYKERSLRSDFLILDNSAYEMTSAQAGMADLLSLGYYMQVDEIVAPDHIMREGPTYAHSLNALAFMSTPVGQYAWKRAGTPSIMVVPQVDPMTQNIDSYDRHARLLMDAWHFTVPYLQGHITLGVSKNMDKMEGGWLLLFRHVIYRLVRDYSLKVHLLGLPHRFENVKRVLQDNPYIRSIDTATPFIQAMSGLSMRDDIVRRPDNYNESKFDDETIVLVKDNIDWMYENFIRPAQKAAPRNVNENERAQFEMRTSGH